MIYFASAKIVKKTQPDKNGLHSVCLRVSYARKSRYFFLNLKTDVSQWDDEAGRFTRSRADYKKANELLTMYISSLAGTIRPPPGVCT